MPPKDVRGVPNVTGQGENIQSLLASLRDAYNSLAASLRGRHITDFDIAGSLAIQEYPKPFVIAGGVIDLTLGTGQVTASPSMITVDTEGAAATDDLDTINGGRDGMILFLRSTDGDRVVTVKNLTGNIALFGDVSLLIGMELVLIYNSMWSWSGTPIWFGLQGQVHNHGGIYAGGLISHNSLTEVTADQHHAAVTLGAGSDAALALSGQQLTLADVLTPAEHLAIGDAAPHHAPVTIGVDVEHSLVGQVLSGVDAAAAQKGHIQLAGELGGTAALPTITAVHSGSAHHAPVTLGGGSDPALALAGQQLTLADVLTPAEHTAIGNAAPHHAAITLGGGSDAALALAGQQLTLADVLTPAEHTAIGDGAPHHARAHVILSSSDHTDTLTGSVLDGDVIIGNVTPAWSRLAIAIPAANVRNVLGIDNAELRPSWKTALDATNPANIAAAASPGTSLVFAHRDHVHAHPDLGDLHTGYLLATGARVGASAQAQSFGALGIKADLIVESTLNAGVTIEGVLLKDGTLPSPTINGTIATTGLTMPAFTLGGAVTGGGQNINNIANVSISTSIVSTAEDGVLYLLGGTAYGKGAVLGVTGKDVTNFEGQLIFGTTNAAQDDVAIRLRITGKLATAVATCTALTWTGMVLSGALLYGANQVVGARVIDARCDDVINSGDATTDGVIDALRDAMITHGLIAAA